jgi:hypothetical protein
VSTQEPLWRWEPPMEPYRQPRWTPSDEMLYLLGLLQQTRADIEKVTMTQPIMVLLPADRTPDEGAKGGMLMGLPFQVSDKVKTVSLVFPVAPRPLSAFELSQVGT